MISQRELEKKYLILIKITESRQSIYMILSTKNLIVLKRFRAQTEIGPVCRLERSLTY